MAELDEAPERAQAPRHVPVMLADVMEWLALRPGHVIVDATVGAGGHASEIARQLGPRGCLIALDRDPAMLEIARGQTVGTNTRFYEANFADLRVVLDEAKIDRADAVLMDLGVASDQLDDPSRGFAFMQVGPLDMRMNPRVGEPAARLVNRLKAADLADIFVRYGEERYSRRVATAIVEARRKQPIETTDELAQIVRRAMPRGRPYQRIHPATRVFQALRIAVNDELTGLERALDVLPKCLKPGGRAVIISFHSLEDRLVKQAFRRRDAWEPLLRKPLVATPVEIARNPRARSAKLRAAKLV